MKALSRLKQNVLANYVGTGLGAAMAVVFVPMYIKFMGIESYGLIGIFGILGAVVNLLDMGLSPTLNRELARLSALPNKAQEMRNLVRTLELPYWGVALAIGITVFALAPLIAHNWVQAKHLSQDTVQQAVMIMGLIMMLQWPMSFYSGGLMGLQRQVILNSINVGIAALRGVGAILILWLVSPTIQAFFIWQVCTSALQISILVIFLWRRLPSASAPAQFQIESLRRVWRFAASLSITSVVTLVLTQLDKVILSRMLTLETFGYYSLAYTVAANLMLLVYPVNTAIFPRFSQLVASGDQDGLKQVYHLSCQLVSVLILSVAAIVTLFAPEILLLWTRNPTTAANTHSIVSLLIIGTALNGLAILPYALQLAHGWTRLMLYTNSVAAIIMAPLIIALTILYQARGAAIAWIILNSGYVFVSLPLMHRRLLRGEQWRWYFEDVGMPLLGALLIAILGRVLITSETPQLVMLVSLAGISLLTLLVTIACAPRIRAQVLDQVKRRVQIGF